MLPGLRPPETPPRMSRIMPGIQNGTGRTGQEERRGKPETGNPAEPICTTGSRSKKGHPEPEKGKPMKEKKEAQYDSVLSYIWAREKDYYEDKHCYGQSLEKKLTTMYALYMAAWAVGELTWDQAFYAYADFTAKLLKIR